MNPSIMVRNLFVSDANTTKRKCLVSSDHSVKLTCHSGGIFCGY